MRQTYMAVVLLGAVLIAPAHGGPKTLFSRESLTLKPEDFSTLPQIEVSSRTDRVYGVSLSIAPPRKLSCLLAAIGSSEARQ